MRWDYLSTCYLDQFISSSFASLTREIFLIQVTSAEIIPSHFEGYDNILSPEAQTHSGFQQNIADGSKLLYSNEHLDRSR